MTLLEVVLATLLLSICLLPAANSLRGAMTGPAGTANNASELDCVSALMETVVAEPYDRLVAAAGNITAASAYSTDPKDNCPALKVFIARYGKDSNGQLGTAGAGDNILYVSVRLATPGSNGAFPLTTLVAR
jgi:type II secretory pathway component PulJ